MKSLKEVPTVVAAITLSTFAWGQETPATPATCTAAPTSLSALNVERALPIADILTTLPPSAPPNVSAAIVAGALEIREIYVYNPQLGTITATVFIVPGGSPLPTPNFNFTTGVVQTVTIKISEILTSCSPLPSMLIIGTIVNSPQSRLYSFSLNGAPVAISLGYTTDNPAKINSFTIVVAGVVTAWSASAAGTLTFPPPTAAPPAPGIGPNIIVKFANGTTAAANTTTQTPISPFLLDASSSTANGALTFAWSTTSNSPAAFTSTGTAGQILMQFPAPGDYTIQLTVTDSTGAKATFSLTVEYTGQPK